MDKSSRMWLVITKISRRSLWLDALQLGHDEAVVGGVAGVVQKAGQPPLAKQLRGPVDVINPRFPCN